MERVVLTLHAMDGRRIAESVEHGWHVTLPVFALPRGLYVWRARGERKTLGSGILAVLPPGARSAQE